jgi:hypothetical protein
MAASGSFRASLILLGPFVWWMWVDLVFCGVSG